LIDRSQRSDAGIRTSERDDEPAGLPVLDSEHVVTADDQLWALGEAAGGRPVSGTEQVDRWKIRGSPGATARAMPPGTRYLEVSRAAATWLTR
jgi:hypothetical protein